MNLLTYISFDIMNFVTNLSCVIIVNYINKVINIINISKVTTIYSNNTTIVIKYNHHYQQFNNINSMNNN